MSVAAADLTRTRPILGRRALPEGQGPPPLLFAKFFVADRSRTSERTRLQGVSFDGGEQ